jgi:NAD(P)H-dependent FMN reductase
MSDSPRLLAFAGSARNASCNKKLVRIAARGARTAGATVTEIDLRDFPMPLYDGDLEAAEGLPEHALRLKALMREHDGFLIASPEYNSSITPLLKNTIDWASRAGDPDEPPLACYRGKVVGLLSASPGGLGGLRGIPTVRSILINIGCIVVPSSHSLSGAMKAFDENGELIDANQRQAVEAVGAAVAELAAKLM